MNKKPSEVGGLFSCQRIIVVGANGAGKTWVATRLAGQLGLPLIHNDALALTTNWVQRPRDAVRNARDEQAEGAAWIIEGGPSILRGTALARAEMVIWLDMSRGLRLRRVLWRTMTHIGRQRPEHPPGNRDWPGRRQFRFIAKVWTSDRVMRESVEAALAGYEGRVMHLKTPQAASQGLERDLFCAFCGLDPSRDQVVFDIRAKWLQRGAQHFAALVKTCGDNLVQDSRICRKAWRGQGGQVHDGRADFRRW